MSNSVHNKLVLSAMALGIIIMFGVSAMQRFVNPDLVITRAGGAGGASAQQEGMNMPPEVGELMQKVKENPDDVHSLIVLSEYLMQAKQHEAAEQFIHRALELDAQNAQAHYLHGIILYSAGKHDEATKSFEQVLAIAEDPSARYSLGILYVHHFNDLDRAIEEFERGLSYPDISQGLRDAINVELEKAKAAKAEQK